MTPDRLSSESRVASRETEIPRLSGVPRVGGERVPEERIQIYSAHRPAGKEMPRISRNWRFSSPVDSESDTRSRNPSSERWRPPSPCSMNSERSRRRHRERDAWARILTSSRRRAVRQSARKHPFAGSRRVCPCPGTRLANDSSRRGRRGGRIPLICSFPFIRSKLIVFQTRRPFPSFSPPFPTYRKRDTLQHPGPVHPRDRSPAAFSGRP